ncbi:hypothetical protein HMPREF2787_10020 [Corynebacterium sp. HMSC061H03]|uniref:rolling circle replication-associated protein n=1 Tax=Corynebacterium sp. HMSC061H03 TaxID=1739291 RepID=UPI0008A86CB7|nr:hypothetical protein [Corynebacterium sp. HMSC061H03]OHR24250.1 hypothetical protein HMPREF2787_10020 [Corynebacterium sp. HMSC061H03]
MLTTIEAVDQVMPWLSPVVLDSSTGDGALIRECREKLPSVLGARETPRDYLVHVSPGTIQLACRDLQALDRRIAAQEKEERERARISEEAAFRRKVVDLYDAMEGVLRWLDAQSGWIVGGKEEDLQLGEMGGRQVKRLLEEEPSIGHDLAVLEFVTDEARLKKDFDFEVLQWHYDQLVKGSCPPWLFWRLMPLFDDILGEKKAPRKIRHWSAKSRRRMLKTCAELDWESVISLSETSDFSMAMVTLTYPGAGKKWLDYVPNAQVAQKHFAALQERFYRAWGVRMQGIWKREFQKRGAPHLHVLMLIPTWGIAREKESPFITDTDVMFFREWLSIAWAEVVGAEGMDYVNHLYAGTGVDQIEKFSSAKNVAGYFLKYASKDSKFATKEYQNLPPWEWSHSDESVGRFWGVLGIKKEVRTVLVSKEEFVAWGRLLQRCCAAKFPGKRRFRGNFHAGWVLTEDLHGTVALVKDLVRSLQAMGGSVLDSPPVGMRGSVFSRVS